MTCPTCFMETASESVGKEEALVENSVTMPERTADPVVYQLVRVDGNGRLVPATEDEVMVLEDSLEDDKTEDKIVSVSGKTLECNTNFAPLSCEIQFEGSEAQFQLEDVEIFAKKPYEPPNPSVDFENVDDPNKETISVLAPSVDGVSHLQSGNPERCSKLLGELNENGSSTSVLGVGLKPDFSLLKGEINLDDLPVKELQETFKATFGRETAVKDKWWLKRRIIMGLTNSCDFSTTTFVIIDNTVVKKGKKGTDKISDQSVLVDCVVQSAMENHEIPSNGDDNQNEIPSHVNGIKNESITSQNKCGSTDADSEQRPAKRVRKPTKRYIEELSEVESRDSGGKIVSITTYPEYNCPPAKLCSSPDQHFEITQERLIRQDSLGGSGVQVPYVSRVRRGRPREDFTSLTPSCMSMPTRLIKNDTAASIEQADCESKNKVLNDGSPSSLSHEPRCQTHVENKNLHVEKKMEIENMDLYNDDEVATVPTANGGMRRKHHRPWTLSEVVKLVEGVAKYGAGRWSEIKRLAFTSYSYRTSVDLKDKWRNLLRASLTELPAGNGMHIPRKHGSILIPAGILSRVRELADT